jgi:hypothetical protein
MKLDDFSSTNLLILSLFICTDIEHDKAISEEFRGGCIYQLTKRGLLTEDCEWELPAAETAELTKHFGVRDESLEHTLFTRILRIQNPWRLRWITEAFAWNDANEKGVAN